ncbi:MAG: hypothetical protein ACXVAN_09595 [Polyangia bacterium]
MSSCSPMVAAVAPSATAASTEPMMRLVLSSPDTVKDDGPAGTFTVCV